jgi:hypothetical protein
MEFIKTTAAKKGSHRKKKNFQTKVKTRQQQRVTFHPAVTLNDLYKRIRTKPY